MDDAHAQIRAEVRLTTCLARSLAIAAWRECDFVSVSRSEYTTQQILLLRHRNRL